MSGPNPSQEGVLDFKLDLDQAVVLGVIPNTSTTTSGDKLDDLDLEEGGLRGWLAVFGAQVSFISQI